MERRAIVLMRLSVRRASGMRLSSSWLSCLSTSKSLVFNITLYIPSLVVAEVATSRIQGRLQTCRSRQYKKGMARQSRGLFSTMCCFASLAASALSNRRYPNRPGARGVKCGEGGLYVYFELFTCIVRLGTDNFGGFPPKRLISAMRSTLATTTQSSEGCVSGNGYRQGALAYRSIIFFLSSSKGHLKKESLWMATQIIHPEWGSSHWAQQYVWAASCTTLVTTLLALLRAG